MFAVLIAILVVISGICAEDYVHSPIQYHSQTDAGSYNYGYDTGLFGSHQFHQEHKDVSGQVRGRYGYTDPYGKLRLVHYKSGPQGFEVISDTEAAKKPNVNKRAYSGITNDIEGHRRASVSSRTPYKPRYSGEYYRKPVLPVTPVRPIVRSKPYISQTYHNRENSRLYVAGRDYGEVVVESPPLRTNIVTSPIPASHTAPLSISHTSYEETSRIADAPVRTVPAPPPSSRLYTASSIPSPPVPIAAPIPVARTVPVVYSGRGIQSPSARLRSGALVGRSADGVRINRSIEPPEQRAPVDVKPSETSNKCTCVLMPPEGTPKCTCA